MGGSFLLRAPLCLQPSLGALFDRRPSYATETVIAVDGVAHTILRFWGPMAQNPNRIWTFWQCPNAQRQAALAFDFATCVAIASMSAGDRQS